MKSDLWTTTVSTQRRYFIGGSDARVIMGDDEGELIRLWQEKRGELEPEDLSRNLTVQLGLVTEELNRRWYEANTGEVITEVQKHVRHPTVRWLAATPDGRVSRMARCSNRNSCCPGTFRKTRPPRNTCRSCNITCGSLRHVRRYCRSLPAAANGWRSRSTPTRSTSTSSSLRNGSSGAAWSRASALAS